MRPCLILRLVVTLAVSLAPATLPGANPNLEDKLIEVLTSEASRHDKDAACAQVKRVGTVRSVPALATLLTDEQLSHSARYALEPMPYPEAGRALLKALDQTTGLTRVGLINSLGFRRESDATPTLAKLLADADAGTAAAAARALGQIANPDALQALEAALATSTGAVHDAQADALLTGANRLLKTGDASKALTVFQRLFTREHKAHVRAAAYRGMITAVRDLSLDFMTTAITGNDASSQLAALQLVHDRTDPVITKTLAGLLPKVSPAVQIALIEGLCQRGDQAALPAVTTLARSPDADVRLAAIKAVGPLGDASVVPLLVQTAAAASGAEQKAARTSLLELRRGDITGGLLAALANAQPAAQVELARALGDRSSTAAIPKLLELAQSGAGTARTASLRALALLAGAPQVGSLVKLVQAANSESARAEARDTLEAVFQRLQSARQNFAVDPIVQALESAAPEVRLALLPICSSLVDPRIRTVLRRALAESNSSLRAAGIRALADTRDEALLPDLLRLAREAGEESFRIIALRGCVRLATQEDGLSNARRLETLQALLDSSSRPEEKRLILAGLANVSDPQSLKLVLPLLGDAAVRAEAAQAATRLASALAGAHAELARTALQQVLARQVEASTRQAAEAALEQIEGQADFITAWQVAGPFRQDGKNYAALFDVVFPPETAEGQPARWKLLPADPDSSPPGAMNLLKALGGEQCVAYARTRIFSEADQEARLKLGTDDGVKAWLNGKLVHARNVARPLAVDSDRVTVTLKKGWNVLLLKITQNNLGWEFCARLVKPDGSRIDGLRFDTGFAER